MAALFEYQVAYKKKFGVRKFRNFTVILLFPELDNEGVVDDPDDFTPEQIGTDVEVTEEMMDQSNDKRSEAMSALSDGKLNKNCHKGFYPGKTQTSLLS